MTPQPIPQPGDRIANYRLGVTGIVDKVGKGRNSETVYIKLEHPGNPAPVPSVPLRTPVKSYEGQIRPEAFTLPFPLTDAAPGPEYDAPLTPDEIEAIAFWLQTLAAAGEYAAEDKEMLGTLTGTQKAQVWEKLTVGSKRELKHLAGLVTVR